MRLKTYMADSMAEAMADLRRQLGDDAIIVSTESGLKGVKIVAAVEETEAFVPNLGVAAGPTRLADDDPLDLVHEALLTQGLPNPLIEKLVDACFLSGVDDPKAALVQGLASILTFHPLGDHGPAQPLMLVGQPGAGKTMTVAKLAARARLSGREVRLITTDIVRAGAVEQLAAFAKVLNVPLAIAEHDRDLARSIASAGPGELVLIDSAGVNPYSVRDMTDLARLVRSVPAEPLLVIPAGGDVVDAIEQIRAFAALGVVRVVATRLDMARRLGGLLAAVDSGGLALADFSSTPEVADGLTPFSAPTLAGMLMPEPDTQAARQAAARGPRS